jgi:hypothetical protein
MADFFSPDQWAAYGDKITEMMQASAGWEREKLAAQREDAAKGLANAMSIARLQSETSRYGIDAQRATAMANLKENARQFDLTHELDMKKFGLSYAQSYSDYVLTPDRYAAGADFVNMASRMISGQGGPAPYGSTGDFHAKTPEDFASLANNPGSAEAPPASAPAAGASSVANPGLSQTAQNAAVGAGAGADARVKAMKAMIDAVPPSEGAGMNDNDYAVMAAARALYSTNLQPGSLEKMRPDQRAIYSSFVKRSGRDWKDYLADYQRGGVGQGRSSAA